FLVMLAGAGTGKPLVYFANRSFFIDKNGCRKNKRRLNQRKLLVRFAVVFTGKEDFLSDVVAFFQDADSGGTVFELAFALIRQANDLYAAGIVFFIPPGKEGCFIHAV